MSMYGKLFASLYQGTLRGRSHAILVFTNLIAHQDINGCVDKHWRAIAEETGLTLDEVKAAIHELESPDEDSRTYEMEGRRIIPMDQHRKWGWQIVNAKKYRAIRNEEERREQNKLAQEKWREKNKKSSGISQDKPESSELSLGEPQSSHIEEDLEEDMGDILCDIPNLPIGSGESKGNENHHARKLSNDDKESLFNIFYKAYPRKEARASAEKAWAKIKNQYELMPVILKAIEEKKKTKQWQDRQFIPLPASWLNARRWEDENDQKQVATPAPSRSWNTSGI